MLKINKKTNRKFYHIELDDSKKYDLIRNQDVGERGGLERVAGKKNGRWKTIGWLVEKDAAKVVGGKLKIVDKKVRSVLKQIEEPILQLRQDYFKSKQKKK